MTNWNSSIMFPTDTVFLNRILDVKFSPSSAGNPMVTLETEVVHPDEYDVAGEIINISGVKVSTWYATKVLDNVEVDSDKTEKAQKRFTQLMTDLFPQDTKRHTINWDNPDLSGIKGLVVMTHMADDEQEQRKTPTSKQIAEAKANGVSGDKLKYVGDVMRNPRTGKPMINHRPVLREIFGLAPKEKADAATAKKAF